MLGNAQLQGTTEAQTKYQPMSAEICSKSDNILLLQWVPLLADDLVFSSIKWKKKSEKKMNIKLTFEMDVGQRHCIIGVCKL